MARSPATKLSTVAGAFVQTGLPNTSVYAVPISTMHATATTAVTTRSAKGLSFFTNAMIMSIRASTKNTPETATSRTMPDAKLTVPLVNEPIARGMLCTCVEAAIMPMANKATTTRGKSHGRLPERLRAKHVSNTYAPAAIPPSSVNANRDSRPMFPSSISLRPQ